MDKRKLALVSVLILIATFTIGLEIGGIITQQQFDQIDFSNQGLEIEIDSKEKNSEYLMINLSYSTLEKLENGDWNKVRKMKSLFYNLETYHYCREYGKSKQTCVSEVRKHLIEQAKSFKSRIRNDLTDQQTKQYIDELTVNDINITDNELND